MTNNTRGGKRPGSGRPTSGRTGITLRLLDSTIDALGTLRQSRREQAELIDELVRKHAKRAASRTAD